MTAYEQMVKTNHYLIKGGVLSEPQKQNIAAQLLDAKGTPIEAQRFYNGVKFPNNTDSSGRRMYPIFFIPPYNNGANYKTILGQTPKTHILAANMYELEILRLLHVLTEVEQHWSPLQIDVKDMVSQTLDRLRTTCFGNEDDGVGECFDTSLVVLRFLASAAPEETKWMRERISSYHHRCSDKRRPWFTLWYFWLCLSELPYEVAHPEIMLYKEDILSYLYKSCVMNSEFDKTIHPVIICIIRNLISRLPEYEYIKNREPYLSEKDGRLHFDMSKNAL